VLPLLKVVLPSNLSRRIPINHLSNIKIIMKVVQQLQLKMIYLALSLYLRVKLVIIIAGPIA